MVTSSNIYYQILTPESVFKESVGNMVLLPGVDGDFGLLAGHTPMVSALRGGVIYIFLNNAITDRYYISDGYVEVSGSACTILAGHATDLSTLNIQECRKKSIEKNKLADNSDDGAVRNLLIIQAKLLEAQANAIENPVYR